MQIENKHFYNMEPVVDLEHFVELLVVTLANRDTIQPILRDTRVNRRARLFPDYKAKIEEAMYSKDALQYLQLIDSYQYYERQADWEMALSDCLNEYLKNKKWKYNFRYDCIEIEFTVDEISNILAEYDEETKKIMKNLICYHDLEYNYPDIRYNKLLDKKYKRDVRRKYIRNGEHTFSNTWTDQ